jgi:DUF4097 and DUF4098 domain-containing protein YvlB
LIEINSTIKSGRQSVAGVMGPVRLVSGSGDIKALYITRALEAKTGNGNIAVSRVGGAATVETSQGNINLREIGPGSSASVTHGTGRVELDGISGSFNATTVTGELNVKGGVYGDWDLKSVSGDIRIQVAREFKYEIDAVTHSGRIQNHNDDIDIPQNTVARDCHQKVNGGGKVVRLRSDGGNIVFD